MKEMEKNNKRLVVEVQTLKDEAKIREGKLSGTLQEIKNLKVRKKEAGSKAVAAYKASDEHKEVLQDYASLSFLKGIKDTQNRVQARYPDLDLGFLLEDPTDPKPIDADPAA